MEHISPVTLGDLLVEQHKLSPEDLERALPAQKTTGESLGKVLVNLGYISEEELYKTLARQLDLDYFSLAEYKKSPPFGLQIPFKFIQEHKFLLLEMEDHKLTVAMSDPLDLATIDALKLCSGCRVKVVISKESEIIEAIERHYGSGTSAMEKIIDDIPEDELGGVEIQADEDIKHLRDMAQEAPVIKLVNLIISKAVGNKASDIHYECYEEKLKVRYRIDGVLHDVESPPKRLQAAIISRIKIMGEMNIAERRLPQDGRIRLRVMGRKIDLRVSTVPTIHGESVVMRILDRSSIMMSLEDLGFPSESKHGFQSLIKKPHGIILVTGPTGSGKTTTLYAALDKLNSTDKKIITIEDPIEYQLSGVNQIQVKPKIGLSFASGLRTIVRQDPDILMVGEIRDLETAEIAIQSALTGHMVFSTLHTNDAPGAITRLLDMGVEHYLVSSCLEGLLAQRLVRVICNSCKKTVKADENTRQLMDSENGGDRVIYKGEGCHDCGSTGYQGRTGIYELLIVTDEIRQLILRKTSTNIIRQEAISQGMVALRDDGWDKVRKGVTTVEEVLRVTQEEGVMDM